MPDYEDLPEAIHLHAALAMVIMALEMIADGKGPPPRIVARTALKILAERHPVAAEHLTFLGPGEKKT